MQGLPETTVTPVCRQGVVGAGVGKTWWRKDRKMIWEQQIISLSLKVFNILDPDNYKGLISGLAQSAGGRLLSQGAVIAQKRAARANLKWNEEGDGRRNVYTVRRKNWRWAEITWESRSFHGMGKWSKKKILACETKVEKGVCLRRLAKFSLYSKRFQSSYCAKFVAKANLKWSGEGKGRRGNACPQTP